MTPEQQARPVPKSLHTITVLAQLARHFARVDEQPLADALDRAMGVLGLEGRPDPHGLEDAAARQLGVAAHRIRTVEAGQ